jgi:hypothetical protein
MDSEIPLKRRVNKKTENRRQQAKSVELTLCEVTAPHEDDVLASSLLSLLETCPRCGSRLHEFPFQLAINLVAVLVRPDTPGLHPGETVSEAYGLRLEANS